MVLMSMDTYEKTMFISEIYRKLDEAESSLAQGKASDAFDAIKAIRKKTMYKLMITQDFICKII